MNKIWLVGYEAGKWWCCDRSPTVTPLSTADTYERSLGSARNEAQMLMMKYPIKRDMSKAVVRYPLGMMGVGVLSAPEYIDYTKERKTPVEVWVIEGASTRYQAIKIAKRDFDSRLLPTTAPS